MTIITRAHTVNMSDVDLVQVNFSRFFPWMDDAYGALLRELGHPLSGIVSEGFATPVVEAKCDYRRPVGLDDEILVQSAVTSVGSTSYVVSHRFADDKGVFAIGSTTHVWIRAVPEQRAEEVPVWLRSAVEPGLLADVDPVR